MKFKIQICFSWAMFMFYYRYVLCFSSKYQTNNKDVCFLKENGEGGRKGRRLSLSMWSNFYACKFGFYFIIYHHFIWKKNNILSRQSQFLCTKTEAYRKAKKITLLSVFVLSYCCCWCCVLSLLFILFSFEKDKFTTHVSIVSFLMENIHKSTITNKWLHY